MAKYHRDSHYFWAVNWQISCYFLWLIYNFDDYFVFGHIYKIHDFFPLQLINNFIFTLCDWMVNFSDSSCSHLSKFIFFFFLYYIQLNFFGIFSHSWHTNSTTFSHNHLMDFAIFSSDLLSNFIFPLKSINELSFYLFIFPTKN